MKIKISVIVPVYNTEAYLKRCVDSILTQNLNDFEILLIDDGSTDTSRKICDEYVEKDNRINVIHKKNGGVSSARNVGLDNAKGEWIYFVDSDDIIKPKALENMLSLTMINLDMIMCGFEVIDEDSKQIYYSLNEVNKNITYIEALKEMYVPSNKWYQGYLWCKLFRKSVIDNFNIRFNERIFFNEDRLFIIQYLCNSRKNVMYRDIPVYTYVQRKASAMSTLKTATYNRKYATDFDAFVSMKDEIKKLPESLGLLWFADQGIRQSYEQNHKMMYEKHDCDTHLHWHMVYGLIKSGVFISYVKDLIRPLLMIVIPQFYCKK